MNERAITKYLFSLTTTTCQVINRRKSKKTSCADATKEINGNAADDLNGYQKNVERQRPIYPRKKAAADCKNESGQMKLDFR